MSLESKELKPTAKNLIGENFGMLGVTSLAGKRPNGGLIWLCSCFCGKTTEVRSDLLLSGKKTYCGCQSEVEYHGMSGTRIYSIWRNMRTRCLDLECPNYANYGGRGISICEDWLTLQGFINNLPEGYKDDLTLDRIDVNGDYSKENCRWVGYDVQARNRRKSSTNKSGKTGVHRRGSDWVATWCFEGTLKRKYFSSTKLGEEQASKMAFEFRDFIIEELNNMGYGYHQNHGL